MAHAELVAHGEHVMTVCNACRYCEQFCPVFPAMEQRRLFGDADLAYLANLCHNCGECLYACQYAPPHEFGIDVPKTLAELRLASYEDYCWPRFVAVAFRHHGAVSSLATTALWSMVMLSATWLFNPAGLFRDQPAGDFYGVVPHAVMVGLFGGVSVLAAGALLLGVGRYWRDLQAKPPRPADGAAVMRALRDALTLKHFHASGVDCTESEESRTPWRRWFHHATFYGFGLCFLSTSVAAFYHLVLDWHAPYDLSSVPVVLGTLGGCGLVLGTLGLLLAQRRRDAALSSADHQGLDISFLVSLLTIAVTGLALLVLRDSPVMGPLLVVHLGAVLAWFVTVPYGKFVHGFYRLAALIKYHAELDDDAMDHSAKT